MIDDGEPAAPLLRAYNSLIAGDCVRFAAARELPELRGAAQQHACVPCFYTGCHWEALGHRAILN